MMLQTVYCLSDIPLLSPQAGSITIEPHSQCQTAMLEAIRLKGEGFGSGAWDILFLIRLTLEV